MKDDTTPQLRALLKPCAGSNCKQMIPNNDDETLCAACLAKVTAPVAAGRRKKSADIYNEDYHTRWIVVQSHLNRLQMNPTDAGKAIGLDPSNFPRWRRKGFVPRYVALALEGLVRRVGLAGDKGERQFLLVLAPEGVKRVLELSPEEAQNVTISGKTYYLLEKKA